MHFIAWRRSAQHQIPTANGQEQRRTLMELIKVEQSLKELENYD